MTNARIALLKKILKTSQTMKTMQTVPTAATPPATPTAAAPPGQPQKTPVVPLQNATPPVQPAQPGQPAQSGQPAQPQTTTPVQTINPAQPGQPGQPAQPGAPQQAQAQLDQFGNPIEKKQSVIYNIVKAAINEKTHTLLRAYSYYKNPKVKNAILRSVANKGIAISNIEGETLKPYVIKGEEEYDKYIKNGAISIFEPVGLTTKSFRISFKHSNKNQLLGTIKLAKDKFEQLGFRSSVVKSEGKYQLKCVANEEIDTNVLYIMASEMLSVVGADLHELKFGSLKRSVYSLDKYGNQDTVIDL